MPTRLMPDVNSPPRKNDARWEYFRDASYHDLW